MPYKDISDRPQDKEKRRTVMLTVTEDCNLRCRYCYEPNKSRDHYMRLEVAQQAVIESMEAEDEFEAIEYDFFGGEPMLAFNLIRDLVDWFHGRPWPKQHIFFISTNGTVLTDEMKNWLVKNQRCVWVGVSIDGNKTAHDLNRSNSYDRVMQNYAFYREHWPEQPIKMTISAETIPHVADSVIDMEEKGWLFSANVVFEDIWGSPEKKTALLDTYAQQLDRLVEYYAARPHLFPVRIVDVGMEKRSEAYRPIDTSDCVRWCGAGHEMIMIDTEGQYFPCHRFSPWVTGRPAPTTLANRQAEWMPEKCTTCPLNTRCPTCVGFNWQTHGDTGIRTTYHCEAFKLEVQASAKLQALRLLQQPKEAILKLPPDEAYKTKLRIEALLDLAEHGV